MVWVGLWLGLRLRCDLDVRWVTRSTREPRTLAKSDVSLTVLGSPLVRVGVRVRVRVSVRVKVRLGLGLG